MTVDVIVQGLVFGNIYALIACGFNVLYRPTNVFNFAQGDLVMVGAMLGAAFTTIIGGPWVLGLVGAVVGVAVIALIEDQVAVTSILRRSSRSTTWIITTLAFSIVVENIVGKVWGANPRQVPLPPGFSQHTHNLGGLLISSYDVAIVVATILIIVGLETAARSKYGRGIAAVAEDREAAMLRGINPVWLTAASFALGGGLAGLTGLIVGPLLLASTTLGPQLLLSGFEAAALGGIGSNRGALIAGYAIGLVQAMGASLFEPGYQSLASFLLLLVVLMVRPAGLFGRVVVRDV
jgi:branched-chain amino acid transport system permease protein